VSATTSEPIPRRTPSNWNIANGLTLLRIALVPLFVVLLLQDGGESTAWRAGASVAFAAAILTDRIDGELARSWDLITDLGKIADPIADKALIGAGLIGLSVLGELWWWVSVVILVREIGITLMRFWVIRHGVIAAGRTGKLKTAAQALAIMLLVLPMPHSVRPVGWVVMAVAFALTVVSGVEYVAEAIRLRSAATRGGHDSPTG
jgi:CDP-diacylglycerol--glycerol-3-phosphate 3-phosphatidyltransferase